MSGIEEISIKPARKFPWRSLAYIILMMGAVSYASTTKVGIVYSILIERLGFNIWMASGLMSLQGFVALIAPLVGFMSDKFRKKFKRTLFPATGVVFMIIGYTLITLGACNSETSWGIATLPTGLVLFYAGMFLIEAPTLSVLVDDFLPFERYMASSLTVFTYLLMIFVSFIVSDTLINMYASYEPGLVATVLITALLGGTALILRGLKPPELKIEEKENTYEGFGKALKSVIASRGMRPFYTSVFMMYLVYSMAAVSLSPTVIEVLTGLYLKPGTQIPIEHKSIALTIYAVFNAGALAGAATFGLAAKIIDFRRLPLIGQVLFMVCLLSGLLSTSIPFTAALALLSGIGWGVFCVFAILYPSMVANERNAGVSYGLLSLSSSSAYAIAPFLVFPLSYSFGSYKIIYLFSLIPFILSLISMKHTLK